MKPGLGLGSLPGADRCVIRLSSFTLLIDVINYLASNCMKLCSCFIKLLHELFLTIPYSASSHTNIRPFTDTEAANTTTKIKIRIFFIHIDNVQLYF